MQKVPIGATSHAGFVSSLALFGGAVYAAFHDKTTESISAAISATLILLTTLGGRYAQAVVLARKVLTPVVQATYSTVGATASTPAGSVQITTKTPLDSEGPGDGLAPLLSGASVTQAPPADKGNPVPKAGA